MKTRLLIVILLLGLSALPGFSQSKNDTTLLGLPGDNLDLYAVLDLFQKSKTIEAFEQSLNSEKTGINNLDLNLDGKVDFIKVVTQKNGEDYTFILQVDVTKTEKQDVAVIMVSKDKDKKVHVQIIGDKDLYGKNYIVEPKPKTAPPATPNPGYTGSDPIKTPPASTTTVVVEQAPIIMYVYSPAYVPYIPPYHYGYYPPYFVPFSVMAIGIYTANHAYYHSGYGYHGNTVVVHNTTNYNNYNISRNSSNTVNHNNVNGNYNRNNTSTRPSNSGVRSSSTQPSTREASGAGRSPSAQPSNRQSKSREGGNLNGSGRSGGRGGRK